MKVISFMLMFLLSSSTYCQIRIGNNCTWNHDEIWGEIHQKTQQYKDIIDSFRMTQVSVGSAPQVMAFIWPLEALPEYSEINSFYITNNFVDQDPATTGTQDWNCGTRTYDGHRGIDIDLWPFTWRMMDNNYVAAVAAASGVVVRVRDGNNNESNCLAPGENATANYIAVWHADNSTSLYLHIRDNSASVTEGQTVTQGQILAFVGSSGRSSNPHLHFEVNRDTVLDSQQAGLIDSYSGTCNSLNTTSWWQNQKPYWEPAVVRIMTHSAAPSLPGFGNNNNFCRSGEIVNAKAAFAPNDAIHFGVAMRDYLQNQSFALTVLYPNATTWFTENNNNNSGNDQRRAYYTYQRTIPGNAPAGTYKALVSFNGTTSVHFFSVNCPVIQNVTGTIVGHQGFKASSSVTSTALVQSGNRLFLQAGSQITLSPGFIARNGSTMKARIRDCNYSE